jgi:hypothetical protein
VGGCQRIDVTFFIITLPELACCNKAGHLVNRGHDLHNEVTAALAGVKRTVRSMLFKNRIRNVRLVDPVLFNNYADLELYADCRK